MSRRRALAIVFAALVLVFAIGSIVTIHSTRNQLIDDIDDDLATQLDTSTQLFDSYTLDELEDLEAIGDVVSENPFAVVIVDERGELLSATPAGPATDPLALPDLPGSSIVDRVGDEFTVDGTDGGPDHRVAVSRLADGRYLAFAFPLNGVSDTIDGLSRTLFVTLFSILVVVSVTNWLLVRVSLRPFDELIDTAEAIADGDMDRRVVTTTTNADIGRLTTSLNTMLDRLQQSLDERRAAENRVKQFAADASHELRTPLTTIAGYSELYLSGAATDTESVQKQMTRINSEANRIGRLVNDLLTLARLDQGRDYELESIDVSALVEDAVSDGRAIDPSQALRLTSNGSSPVVAGDRDALHQVFTNLIANTRQHASAANVDIAVVTDDDAHVTVTVADDGPGMSHDVADRVFDRFFRAERSQTSIRTSGLGLSIVAAIVESHGGTVDVESAPGVGSTFTVVLPTVPSETSPISSVESSFESSSERDMHTDDHRDRSGGAGGG